MPFSLNFTNTKLNPIYYLLALSAAHHILHVSRIRVKMNLASFNPPNISFSSQVATKW
jgi:hypothetical protein